MNENDRVSLDPLPVTPTLSRPALSSTDETALLRAARTDLTHFEPIYDRYFAPIYGYCLKRVDDPQTAEDLTSEIFAQAMRDLKHYRGGSVAAWLFCIARNRVTDFYRRRRSSVQIETVAHTLAAPHLLPLDTVVQAEENQRIRDLVAQLPEDQRELLMLKINSGLSAQEIGEITAKKAGTVRVALHRIVMQLRRQYEEEES